LLPDISICLDKEDDDDDDVEEEEEDRSMYQAYLSPDCNNVQLKKGIYTEVPHVVHSFIMLFIHSKTKQYVIFNSLLFSVDPLYQGSGSSPGSSLSRRRKIRVTPDVLSSIASDSTCTLTDTTLTEQMYTARGSSGSPGGSDTELDDTFMPEMDSPDELEDSILECKSIYPRFTY
jgi:hypothetical protein